MVCVLAGASSFSPLSAPSLPGQNPDTTPPVLAGKPSHDPDDCSSPALLLLFLRLLLLTVAELL